MKIHKDLLVWQKSIKFVKRLYEITEPFPVNEKFGLANQIRRAGVSIPSNIAEGAARNSNKEYLQFLYIALGSASEIDTQLIIAEELGYIKYTGTELETELTTISKMLSNLIKKIKQRLTLKTNPSH